MTCQKFVTAARHRAPRCLLWPLAALAAAVLVLAGCSQTSQHRAKAAEENETVRYDLPTVGDRTVVGKAEPIQIGGVGLVENLEGTGGDCPHDTYRAMLVEQFKRQNVQHYNKLLNSPDCALVIVEASITPGAAKGDKLDVEVKLPPGSRATSLRGGVLRKCYLYNYDFARNLRPDYQGSQGLLKGHKLAEAQGAVLVGDDSAGVRQGRIWQGANNIAEQPLALIMNPDSQQARFTALIMERINNTFFTGPRGASDSRLAHTADNVSISLRMPPQYRHNLPRFLRVVRAIPLSESVDVADKDGDRLSYRQKLVRDLLDPSRAVIASIRLEALGDKSVPALKAGLSSPHPLVRFLSAESLAYLGSAAGCEELGRAAASYPILRAYALSALASLDESASVLQLKQIINSDLDDQARTGAYRALWLMNERDPLVRGERLNESFWLHSVAPNSRPLIHVSTQKRAEVVMFGKASALRPPFSLLAGEFAVTATSDSAAALVSWVPRGGTEPTRKTCQLEVEDVIRCMAEMGAGFSEVLALLQQASSCEALGCPLRIDSLPQAGTAHELHRLGKEGTGEDLLPAGAPPVRQAVTEGGR